MENKSAIVLALYEEEKARLEALIKECLEGLEGPDYLTAHSYQKALYKVNITIRTLNRLEDKHYEHKQNYARRIANIRKDIESTDSEYLKKYYYELLQRETERFEDLNTIFPSDTSKLNDGILEKALVDLISKKIKKFKIIFNRSEGISLELSARGQVIKIVSSVVKKSDVSLLQLRLLQKLGFVFTKRNKLVCQVKNIDENTLYELRLILSRIVFDVYYFRHPAKENFIEF